MSSVSFFYQDTSFKLKNKKKLKDWIFYVVSKERKKLKSLRYIFCNDDFVLSLNIQYLNHNTLTDIITFDLSENKNHIDGEVYISIDRIEENAKKFSCSVEDELHRVIIHGVLHLIGYKDKTYIEKREMRRLEDFYLKSL